MASGSNILTLSRPDRGIVVFHLWQSLSYGARMALSFLLILAGFAVQIASGFVDYGLLLIITGAVLIFTGNLLLLVKGYDNRVDQRYLDPAASWESVGIDKLRELVALDKKLSRWDASVMDITNPRGLWSFIILLALMVAAVIFLPGVVKVLAIDAGLLLFPHWYTGIRRLLRMPKLIVKAESILGVLETASPYLDDWDIDVMMEIRGKQTQLPQDIKFRLMPKKEGGDGGFLGFYGQCSTNDVQGKSYPYFYTVIVAKNGYGLKELSSNYQPPSGIVAEFDTQGEVETFVIRQYADKKTGYHTNPVAAAGIFQAGLSQAQLAVASK